MRERQTDRETSREGARERERKREFSENMLGRVCLLKLDKNVHVCWGCFREG